MDKSKQSELAAWGCQTCGRVFAADAQAEALDCCHGTAVKLIAESEQPGALKLSAWACDRCWLAYADEEAARRCCGGTATKLVPQVHGEVTVPMHLGRPGTTGASPTADAHRRADRLYRK